MLKVYSLRYESTAVKYRRMFAGGLYLINEFQVTINCVTKI